MYSKRISQVDRLRTKNECELVVFMLIKLMLPCPSSQCCHVHYAYAFAIRDNKNSSTTVPSGILAIMPYIADKRFNSILLLIILASYLLSLS
jgi:hypothetical protein